MAHRWTGVGGRDNQLCTIEDTVGRLPGALDDARLLREVTSLADTRVIIVYGSRDGVFRIDGTVADKLKRDYPNVDLIRMDGCGHDPFEEDVSGFMIALEKSLESEKK